MLPKKIASKITALVLLNLSVLVILIVGSADWINENFFHSYLTDEVEGRIVSHAHLLKENSEETIIKYIEEIETGKQSYFIKFDSDLEPVYVSANLSETMLRGFTDWVNQYGDKAVNISEPYIEHVDAGIQFHIPHVRALMPIYEEDNGQITGYIFLDQDTGKLNKARSQLLLLFILMGIVTLLVGFMFTKYITNKISNPINHMSKMTKNIAEGDYDIKLDVRGEDEVSHLAESIQSMTNQLKEYRDSRRHFISHISHDLRTPITYIKGYAAVMGDAPPTDNLEEWKANIQVIYKEATRMEHLVSDLFLLTKLEEGKIKLEKKEVPIIEWLKYLYESRELMFDQKSIEHRLNIDVQSEELYVLMDPYRMEQALINIIENAIRHTPKNGKITLDLTKTRQEVIISVQDSGVGIADKDITHIWKRFYKADKSRNRNQSRTGLGLAIVKEIVEAHNGKVTVVSKLNKGSKFSIHLPIE